MTLELLTIYLNKIYSKDTCYPLCRDTWNIDNPTLGHCAIVSLIVNDYFGGEIYKVKVDGISHYFNIVNNEIVDLTANQFNKEIDYSNKELKVREEIFDNEDTVARYNLLKTRLQCEINKCSKIVIAGSATFYKEVLELKEELEKNNYIVIDYPEKINVESDYKEAYESFYESLNNTDDLLLFNIDKKGIEGYIGYESFAELSYLVVKKIQGNKDHKIYIYKMPSKDVGCYDEIVQFLKLGYIELYK